MSYGHICKSYWCSLATWNRTWALLWHRQGFWGFQKLFKYIQEKISFALIYKCLNQNTLIKQSIILIEQSHFELVLFTCTITAKIVSHANFNSGVITDRLEYIMLLKLPMILSSNSFIFHLLFSLEIMPEIDINTWIFQRYNYKQAQNYTLRVKIL